MQGWIFGILLSICGSVAANVGLLLQKLSLMQHPVGRGVWRQPKWVCGFILFMLAQAVGAVALSFAPLSILGALSGLSLVSNSIFAPLLLQEVFTLLHLISTLVLIIGSVLVVSFSPTPSEYTKFRMDDFWELAIAPVTIVVFSCSALVLTCLYARVKYAEHRIAQDAGGCRDMRATEVPGAGRFHNEKLVAPADPFTYDLASAIAGAMSVTLFKASSLMIRMNVNNPNDPLEIALIFLIALSLVFSMFSVYLMNSSLHYFDALFVIPLYYSLSTMCQSILGGVFYGEFYAYSRVEAIGFCLGLSTNIIGVWVLSIANTGIADSDEVIAEEEPDTLRASLAEIRTLAPRRQGSIVATRSLAVPIRHTSVVAKSILEHAFSAETVDVPEELREEEPMHADWANGILGQLTDGGVRLMIAQNPSRNSRRSRDTARMLRSGTTDEVQY